MTNAPERLRKKIEKILEEGFDDYKDGWSYYESVIPKLEQLFKAEMKKNLKMLLDA
jgi:hypothetical protein